MKAIISASQLHGTIRANPSKSFTQRAYAMAALANGPSVITNPSWSDDGCHALGIVSNMGAEVALTGKDVRINPAAQQPEDEWYVGEAGLSLRMFSAIASLYDREITISGAGSLASRDHGFILESLAQMGVSVQGEDLPIAVLGPIIPGTYHLDGSQSSQFLTGLLIALPTLKDDSTLLVSNLKSTPYIDMTIEMMAQFGVDVRHDAYKRFALPGNQQYNGSEVAIEADWSGVAFILVAGAIAGSIAIADISPKSAQADRAVLDALEIAGCNVQWNENYLTVISNHITPFEFDATHCPDLFPPLVALACFAQGTSRLRGTHRLRNKESDRLVTLMEEFDRLGVSIAHEDDCMVIHGVQSVSPARVSGRNDHRIAMALACAALRSSGPVEIAQAECVTKSYGNFFSDLNELGAQVSGDKFLLCRQDASSYLR